MSNSYNSRGADRSAGDVGIHFDIPTRGYRSNRFVDRERTERNNRKRIEREKEAAEWKQGIDRRRSYEQGWDERGKEAGRYKNVIGSREDHEEGHGNDYNMSCRHDRDDKQTAGLERSEDSKGRTPLDDREDDDSGSRQTKHSSRTSSRRSSGHGTPLDKPDKPIVTFAQELAKMMSNELNRSMAQKQVDAARKESEKASRVCEEFKKFVTSFPASYERASQDSKDKKARLEKLTKELKEIESTITTTDIASHIKSLLRAEARTSSVSVEERLNRVEMQNEQLKEQIQILKQESSIREDEVKTWHEASKAAIAEATLSQNLLTVLQAKYEAQESQIASLNIDAMHRTTEKLKDDLAQVVSVNDVLSAKQKQIEGSQETLSSLPSKIQRCQLAIQDISPIVEQSTKDYRSIETDVGELKVALGLLAENFKSINEDVAIYDIRIKGIESITHNLEEAVQRIESRACNPMSSAAERAMPSTITLQQQQASQPPSSVLNQELRESLGVSQPMFDMLNLIHRQIDLLRRILPETIAESQNEALTQLKIQIEARQDEFEEKLKDLGMKHERHAESTSGLLDATSQPAASSETAHSIQALAIVIEKDLRANIHGLQSSVVNLESKSNNHDIGLRTLDARMNNIYTDHLAHQIIGTLADAYPNLPRVDALVHQLSESQTKLESDAQILNEHIKQVLDNVQKNSESIDALKQAQDAEGDQQKRDAKSGSKYSQSPDATGATSTCLTKSGNDRVSSIQLDTLDAKLERVAGGVHDLHDDFMEFSKRVETIENHLSRVIAKDSASTKRAATSSPSISDSASEAAAQKVVGRPLKKPKVKRKSTGPFIDEGDDD